MGIIRNRENRLEDNLGCRMEIYWNIYIYNNIGGILGCILGDTWGRGGLLTDWGFVRAWQFFHHMRPVNLKGSLRNPSHPSSSFFILHCSPLHRSSWSIFPVLLFPLWSLVIFLLAFPLWSLVIFPVFHRHFFIQALNGSAKNNSSLCENSH